MPRSSAQPLAAFRQELPHRPLWTIASVLAAREPGVALLDAQGDPETDGRFAVLGWRPTRVLRWPAGRPGAIDGLRHLLGPRRLGPDPDGVAPFRGGFLGWVAYDLGRDVERLPSKNALDP